MSIKIPIYKQANYLVLDQAERAHEKGKRLELQALKKALKDNIVLWKKFNGGEEKYESSFLARTLSNLVAKGFLENPDKGVYKITQRGREAGGQLEDELIAEVEFEFPEISKKLSGKELTDAIYKDHAHHYYIPHHMILTERNMAHLAEKKYRDDVTIGIGLL